MTEFSVLEIANVLSVISLFFLIARRRDATTQLIVLFTYGTLHFGFATLALCLDESTNVIIALHNQGGGALATLSTLLLLGVTFILLGRHALDAFSVWSGKERRIVHYVFLMMLIIMCGYFANARQGDWLQLKNVVSIEAMLLLLLIGFSGTIDGVNLNEKIFYIFGVIGLLVLGGVNFIALYEVLSRSSWAGTANSSGAMVYRASSILFNPNLFGFWASLIYLGCAYGLHQYSARRKLMMWGMIFSSISIYLSGARSTAYFLLAVLLLASLLLKARARWMPFFLLPLTFTVTYIVSRCMGVLFNDIHGSLNSLVLLGGRFFDAPMYLLDYLLKMVGITGSISIGVPAEIQTSIEGRFVGEGRDSGWMVLYQDVGWFGVTAFIIPCCLLLMRGIRTYISFPSPSSVYALAMFFYCLLIGLVMRFQIFPVWLFIGIVLIPCLVFWRRTAVFLKV